MGFNSELVHTMVAGYITRPQQREEVLRSAAKLGIKLDDDFQRDALLFSGLTCRVKFLDVEPLIQSVFDFLANEGCQLALFSIVHSDFVGLRKKLRGKLFGKIGLIYTAIFSNQLIIPNEVRRDLSLKAKFSFLRLCAQMTSVQLDEFRGVYEPLNNHISASMKLKIRCLPAGEFGSGAHLLSWPIHSDEDLTLDLENETFLVRLGSSFVVQLDPLLKDLIETTLDDGMPGNFKEKLRAGVGNLYSKVEVDELLDKLRELDILI